MRFLCTTAYIETTTGQFTYGGIDLDSLELIQDCKIENAINSGDKQKLCIMQLTNGQVTKVVNDKYLWFISGDSIKDSIFIDGYKRFIYVQAHQIGLLEAQGYKLCNCKKKEWGQWKFNDQILNGYKAYPSKMGTSCVFSTIAEKVKSEFETSHCLNWTTYLLIINWCIATVVGFINSYEIYKLPLERYVPERVKRFLFATQDLKYTANLLIALKKILWVNKNTVDGSLYVSALADKLYESMSDIARGLLYFRPESRIDGDIPINEKCSIYIEHASTFEQAPKDGYNVTINTSNYNVSLYLENMQILANNQLQILGVQNAIVQGTYGGNVKIAVNDSCDDIILSIEPVITERFIGLNTAFENLYRVTGMNQYKQWEYAKRFEVIDINKNRLPYCINRGLNAYIKTKLSREMTTEEFESLLDYYRVKDQYKERKPRLETMETPQRLNKYDFTIARYTVGNLGNCYQVKEAQPGMEYVLYKNGVEYKRILAFNLGVISKIDRLSIYNSISRIYLDLARKSYIQYMDRGWITIDDYWWGSDYLAPATADILDYNDFHIRLDVLTGVYYVCICCTDAIIGLQDENIQTGYIGGPQQYGGRVYKKVFGCKDFDSAVNVIKVLEKEMNNTAEYKVAVRDTIYKLYRSYVYGNRKQDKADKIKNLAELNGIIQIVCKGLLGIHIEDTNTIDTLRKIGIIGG